MPFKSEKQKRWMYANKPEMAKEWSDKYGSKPKKTSKKAKKTKVSKAKPKVYKSRGKVERR